MTNKIFAFLTAKEENLQALVFEELDDSQASAVTGGKKLAAFGTGLASADRTSGTSLVFVAE